MDQLDSLIADIINENRVAFPSVTDPRRNAVITNVTEGEGEMETATQEPSMVNIWCQGCSAFLETVERGEEDSVRDYCTTCDPDTTSQWEMQGHRVQPVEGGLADEPHMGGEAPDPWFSCDECGSHQFYLQTTYDQQITYTDTSDSESESLWFDDPINNSHPQVIEREAYCENCDTRQDGWDVG